jgi:hypothetical protein
VAVQRVSGEPLSLVTGNLTGISPIPVLPEERQDRGKSHGFSRVALLVKLLGCHLTGNSLGQNRDHL